jgi:hypothetical protein
LANCFRDARWLALIGAQMNTMWLEEEQENGNSDTYKN